MFLFTENSQAVDFYQDNYLTFQFHLIKLWELDAESFLEAGVGVLPFVPLMKNGLSLLKKVEERIYNDNKSREERADLLNSLAILTGLTDKKLALDLLNRRRDIMIESPVYEFIKDEVRKQGIIE